MGKDNLIIKLDNIHEKKKFNNQTMSHQGEEVVLTFETICLGSCAVHCRMWSSIPGLYPLDAYSVPSSIPPSPGYGN